MLKKGKEKSVGGEKRGGYLSKSYYIFLGKVVKRPGGEAIKSKIGARKIFYAKIEALSARQISWRSGGGFIRVVV